MEEKLDKLIALMESQNKAWEKTLQLLNNINIVLVEKYKAADLLLEEHPPMGAPRHANTTPPLHKPRENPLNTFGDGQPYGYDLEEERKSTPQSFPATVNSTEEVQQPQQAFKEPPPEIPMTSKAEMMEQVEKRELSS